MHDGTYDKPFVLDTGMWRFLHFDFESVQSAMHRLDPDRLCLAYTRKMMSFLLFNGTPQRILMLGLGGGSLAKFCYRRLPATAVTTVEVNPDVIALRGEFCVPADDDRFRVVHADAATYLAQLQRHKDVIVADACDHAGTAQQLDTLDFYRNVRRSLSAEGVFVTNVCGETDTRATHFKKIRAVFGDGVMILRVKQHRNVIVLARKQSRTTICWERLEQAALELKRRFGLDFPEYLNRLEHDWKRHRWEDVFA